MGHAGNVVETVRGRRSSAWYVAVMLHAAILVAMLLLAGCGGSGSDSGKPEARGETRIKDRYG